MELWTAFITGLFGSLHCIGMCGPIALALPSGFSSSPALVFSRLLYNGGRIITYSLMGAILGLVGQGIAIAGYQQIISIVLGVVLLLSAIFTLNLESGLLSFSSAGRLMTWLKTALGRRLRVSSQSSLFTIGILNGFLPCGFVYLALSGALTTGSVVNSMAYMALFGLGTLPMMLSASIMGGFISQKLRKRIQPVLTVFVIVFALLLIARGLNLGIPFLSPEIGADGGIENCE